jgi:hypothetical protein
MRWLGVAGWALFAASTGAGCDATEEPVQVPIQDYCEPDVAGGTPFECCRICAVGQELLTDGCERAPAPSDWPSRSATWNEWREWCDWASVSAGRCSSGVSFVTWHSLGVGETRFFGAGGNFLALEGITDFGADPCGFEWYWPRVVDCEPSTTEMACRPPLE